MEPGRVTILDDRKIDWLASYRRGACLETGVDMEAETLNEHLHFRALTQEEQDSFLTVPFFTKFELGFRLYKWTEFGLVNPKGKITPFWLPWTSLKIGDRVVPGFKELRMRYRNVNGAVGTPRDFTRTRNAVREEWNAMSSILHAQLTQAAWGFVGVTRGQPAYEDPRLKDIFLMGGDYQLCIPNLTTKHIKRTG